MFVWNEHSPVLLHEKSPGTHLQISSLEVNLDQSSSLLRDLHLQMKAVRTWSNSRFGIQVRVNIYMCMCLCVRMSMCLCLWVCFCACVCVCCQSLVAWGGIVCCAHGLGGHTSAPAFRLMCFSMQETIKPSPSKRKPSSRPASAASSSRRSSTKKKAGKRTGGRSTLF